MLDVEEDVEGIAVAEELLGEVGEIDTGIAKGDMQGMAGTEGAQLLVAMLGMGIVALVLVTDGMVDALVVALAAVVSTDVVALSGLDDAAAVDGRLQEAGKTLRLGLGVGLVSRHTRPTGYTASAASPVVTSPSVTGIRRLPS